MIHVSNLTKHYGPVRAVNDVSFGVRQGQVVGFLGPNGAGKSTTLKILTGYLHPDSGRVEVAGCSLHSDPIEARRRTGYLPENTPLYRAMRVDAYLDFAARSRGMRRGARRTAFARVVEQCRLEGYTRRRVGELSKGYRQRVGLAQALIGDPQVLLLDEPTSGLDPAEIVRIRELIATLAGDKTVMLSTHILAEVTEIAERVIILAGGRVVADGTPLDLVQNEPAALSVTVKADPEEAQQFFQGLEGVTAVRVSGRDGTGRIGFLLDVEDRYEVAAAIHRLAARRQWDLFELRHEISSLETVFLRCTAPGKPAEEVA